MSVPCAVPLALSGTPLELPIAAAATPPAPAPPTAAAAACPVAAASEEQEQEREHARASAAAEAAAGTAESSCARSFCRAETNIEAERTMAGRESMQQMKEATNQPAVGCAWLTSSGNSLHSALKAAACDCSASLDGP